MRTTAALTLFLTLANLSPSLVSAADSSKNGDKKKDAEPENPCTIRAPSGSFFDLNPINLVPANNDNKKYKSRQAEHSWSANGFDYGSNFTFNVCGPVVEKLDSVVGIEKSRYKNVSAYYEKGGKTYSIGENNDGFVFRGRKLVLNYTGGSPCGESNDRRDVGLTDLEDLERRAMLKGPGNRRIGSGLRAIKDGKGKGDDKDDEEDDDDDDDERDDGRKKGSGRKGSDTTKRRKSTVVSLLCERDPAPKTPPATVSFVSTDEDECTYFFEVRSSAACPTVAMQKQSVGPSGVFGVITVIAILAYLIGGVVYQRTVMHQRGWRQLPNYTLWAGLYSFVSDLFVILTSSCARFLPGRGSKGYNQLSGNGHANGRGGRVAINDDENRLIDQLDEEWED